MEEGEGMLSPEIEHIVRWSWHGQLARLHGAHCILRRAGQAKRPVVGLGPGGRTSLKKTSGGLQNLEKKTQTACAPTNATFHHTPHAEPYELALNFVAPSGRRHALMTMDHPSG